MHRIAHTFFHMIFRAGSSTWCGGFQSKPNIHLFNEDWTTSNKIRNRRNASAEASIEFEFLIKNFEIASIKYRKPRTPSFRYRESKKLKTFPWHWKMSSTLRNCWKVCAKLIFDKNLADFHRLKNVASQKPLPCCWEITLLNNFARRVCVCVCSPGHTKRFIFGTREQSQWL